MTLPLFATEVTYQEIQWTFIDIDSSPIEELDHINEPTWDVYSSNYLDFLDTIFPSKKDIMEDLTGHDKAWDDLHHCSYFLLVLDNI